MKILLDNQESLDIFYSALCNGLSYFSGYGCEITYKKSDYKNAKEKLIVTSTPCYEDVLMQILKDGGLLTMKDIEGDGSMTSSIKIQDVYDRVQKTPIKFLIEMIEENDDATTADVVLQTVFFEDIIFG